MRTCQTDILVAFVLGITLWAATARADVAIEGLDDDVEDVVRGFLSLDELPCESPRWWVGRRFKQAPAEIQRAMETLGFYNAQVQPDLAWQDECWLATFSVTPGDRVLVHTFQLDIDQPLAGEPQMVALGDNLELKEGKPFSHKDYEDLKDNLLDVAQDIGYFDADFSRHVVTVDPQANQADVDLVLAGGIRYRISDIRAEQTSLRPELFNKYLSVEEGEYYDAKDLNTTYKNLLESDYFSRVVITPLLELREDGEVPLQIIAAPGSRRTLQLGGGYATDTGPRVRGDLRYRRLNDRGHRAGASAMVSQVTQEVRAQYRLPYGDPLDEWLFAETSYVEEETDTTDSTAYTLGVGRTHRRGRHWVETNYVNYTLEDFQIGDQQNGRSNLLILGTSLSRTTSIDSPRPLRGYSISMDLRGATKQLVSDSKFVQLIGRGRYILPLGSRLRVLNRLHAGWTWQDQFEDLPPSVRFFAGGDNSVRGYGYQRLGPEENGEVVGGRKLLTGSIELDGLIRPNWSLAAFVDSGSAFDDKPEFSTGVGLGIRWYSPLGPLRFDLAHPLDDPNREFRVHISLGTDL